jgi:hypothetical protein
MLTSTSTETDEARKEVVRLFYHPAAILLQYGDNE